MTIYPFRGPLVRPSTESDKLEERDREEDEEEKGGDGRGGEDSEEQGDSFASEGDLSKKLAKALGGQKAAPVKSTGGVSMLSLRVQKKK